MTRLVALPHLQTAAVDPKEWLVTIRGESMPAPPLLKAWDYSTALRFECQISVDLELVHEECGLGPDAELLAVALVWASSTNRRFVGASTPVDRSGTLAMEFDIDPTVVGGRLLLHRQVLLGRPGSTTSRLAARREGAVLWDEERSRRTSIILEGDAARFPTEVIDFSIGRVADPSAAWWLEYDFSELDASPLASMRLYLNAGHARLKPLLEGDDSEGTRLVGDVMSWDIGRAMIHGALDSGEFVDGWGQFRPGSLGETLELLIRRVWPTHDARSLRGMRAENRGLFEARLQGRLNLLGSS